MNAQDHRTARLWPLLSLALNVLLLAILLKPASSDKISGVATPVSPVATAVPMRPSSFPAATAAVARKDDWRDWLAELRDHGVPDKVLATLVISDFETRWEAQRRELQRRCNRGDIDESTVTQFVEQHDAGLENELQKALGIDGFVKWDRANVLRDLNTDRIQLADAEAEAVYRLQKDFAREEAGLKQAHQGGEIDEVDLDQRLAAAEKNNEEKLKSLLGDTRYAALKAPEDGSRGDLVRTLKTIPVTDAQSAALIAAQAQWNEQRRALDNAGGSSAEQLRAIDAARDAQYLRVLGPDGFALLQRSQDRRYQAMQRYASAWQLTGDQMDSIYGLLLDSENSALAYQQRAHDVETQGGHVDWTGVEANIQDALQQTRQGLHDYLGEDRFNLMKRNFVFDSSEFSSP